MLAALADAADCRDELDAYLRGVGLRGFTLSFSDRRRGGITAVGVVVKEEADAPAFPTLVAIEQFLTTAPLSPYVREGALKAFRLLAEAEARAHRTAADFVHFHEVGAVDALIDVIGVFWLVERLQPDRIVVSPLRLGKGFVAAAHGALPVPAPATVELLRGIPCFSGDVDGEYTTPTGAALVAALGDVFSTSPVIRLLKVGYGPGTADPPGFPNVLRVFWGEQLGPAGETVAVIEAHVDDMTAEELSAAARAVEEAGALDVTLAPLMMKKGRVGYNIKAIVPPPRQNEIAELLLQWTTTLGVRLYETRRVTLNRREVLATTPFGSGRVKVAELPDGSFRYHAEYDDAQRLAARAGVSFRVVARALEAAAQDLLNRP